MESVEKRLDLIENKLKEVDQFFKAWDNNQEMIARHLREKKAKENDD